MYLTYKKITAILSQKEKSMQKFLQIFHLLIGVAGTVGLNEYAHVWLYSHLSVYVWCVIVSLALHAISPSIFQGPTDAEKSKAGLTGYSLIFCLFLFGASFAHAQTVPQTPNGVVT